MGQQPGRRSREGSRWIGGRGGSRRQQRQVARQVQATWRTAVSMLWMALATRHC